MKRGLWLAAALLLCSAILAAVFGPDLYRGMRLNRFLQNAQNAFSDHDFKTARAWASLAYRNNPDSVVAAGMLADLADQEGNPESLVWRRQVVQISGGEVNATLAWAQSALLFGDLRTARYALDLASKPAENRADYYSLRGTYALQSGEWMEADRSYQKAFDLSPSDPVNAVNLATLRLQATDPKLASDARARLEDTLGKPNAGLEAARALFQDAVKREDWKAAAHLAELALKDPRSSIRDRLNELTALSFTDPVQAAENEKRVVQDLSAHPESVAAWIHWMNAQGKERSALSWVENAPEPIRTRPDLLLARADLMMKLKAWTELETFLLGSNLGSQEFMRQLMLLRVHRELGRPEFAQAWARYVSALGEASVASLIVAQTLQDWGWQDESEEILKKLLERNVGSHSEAFGALARIYRQKGNTLGLFELEKEFLQRNPENTEHGNNYAYLSLLLGLGEAKSITLAQKNYERYPKHPAAAATWALALYRQGKLDEGLRVLEALPPESLKQPGPAFCQGVILADKGEPDKAIACFELAKQVILLPEEKAWIEKALSISKQIFPPD